MNINSAFPSKFLKASDLNGQAVTVKIAGVKIEQVGQGQDSKPVVYFAGKQKGLVLNKTNSNKIANIAGSQETDDWKGATILIYPTETEFGGETVECIRVRAPKAATGTRRVEPEPEPEPTYDDADAAATDDDSVPF